MKMEEAAGKKSAATKKMFSLSSFFPRTRNKDNKENLEKLFSSCSRRFLLIQEGRTKGRRVREIRNSRLIIEID